MFIPRSTRIPFLSLVAVLVALAMPAPAGAAGETATFLSPVDGVVVGGDSVLIRVSASPGSVIFENGEVRLDGGSAANGCDAGSTTMDPVPLEFEVFELSCTWNASGVADGTHTLTAFVSDGGGGLVAPGMAPDNPITVTVDNTAPTGGSVTVPNQEGTATTVNIGYAPGTDDHEGAVYMQRASATLTGSTCGTFGSFSTLFFIDLRAIASPFVDNGLSTGNCYMYRLQEYDQANNVAYYTSPNVVKVTSATPPPAPTPPQLALSLASTSASVKVSGTTVTYRPGASNSFYPPALGSFTVTATPSSGSGVYSSVSFPDLDGAATAWTPAGSVDSTAPFQATYTYVEGAAGSGTQTVTVTDANALTATASFTLVRDAAGPTGASVKATLGTATGGAAPIVVATAAGSDPAGIASSVLKRTVGERENGDCVRFTDVATIATNPAASYTDTNTAEDRCYVYQLVVTDGVGNTTSVNSELVIVNSKRAVVKASSGNDRINGTDDAEYVALGAGNDVVRLGGGNDAANGGIGNDTIRGNLGDDCILFGGGGDDLIFGGPGADCINGNHGNDKLHGGSGNDSVDGAHGDDFMTGGPGDDNMDASFGNDKVGGGDGNDSIVGGYGDDLLLGHDGNDSLRGDNGNDTVNGGPGDDKAFGARGDDLVVGGDGNDTLGGNYGFDALYGGDGNDTIEDEVFTAPASALERFGMFGGNGNDSMTLHWIADYDTRDLNDAWLVDRWRPTPYRINCGGGSDTVKIHLTAKPTSRYDRSAQHGIQLEDCGSATVEFADETWFVNQCTNLYPSIESGLRSRVGVNGRAKTWKFGPKCQKQIDEREDLLGSL